MTPTRELRLNKGLSLHALADLAGVAYGTACRMDEGLPVRAASAKAIADVLGVRVTDLIAVKVGRSPW